MKTKSLLSLLIMNSLISLLSCNKADEQIQKQEELSPLFTTVDAIRNGTQCTPDHNNGGLKCDFKVGNDLTFTMWGVGKSETSTVVGKSVGEDGEYSLRFVKDFPCLVVVAGKKIMDRTKAELSQTEQIKFLYQDRQAFVSPGNGYTYKNADECETATNALRKVENEMGPAPYEEQLRELDQ